MPPGSKTPYPVRLVPAAAGNLCSPAGRQTAAVLCRAREGCVQIPASVGVMSITWRHRLLEVGNITMHDYPPYFLFYMHDFAAAR
jgi:isopentenyl diphosphate isomerase/L-lactate dehydrogenase-like FMN-dependent dehydrogenase